MVPPPSVNDTHCDGPGLLSTTRPWWTISCKAKMYIDDISTTYDLPPKINLTGRWAIVSGANSGIGQACTKILAAWGCNVILACRNPPPHEPHPDQVIKEIKQHLEDSNLGVDPALEWWEIDYSKMESVRAFGKRWLESDRVLDYLFNNAGLTVKNLIITEDGYELTHQVNFLSHCLLTFIILPSMKNSKGPRIVNTCSSFHNGGVLDFANFNNEKKTSRGLEGVQAYCDSKLQHMMFTRELQNRLSKSQDYGHIIVNGIHPGFVASNIWNNPTIRALPWFIRSPLDSIINYMSITTHQGSLSMIYAALDPEKGFSESELSSNSHPNPGESYRKGGKYLNRTTEYTARPEVDDVLARARLWQRVVEDVKADRNGLIKDLPGHPEGLA